jgi:predicted nucleic acid-binding protein
MDEIICLDTYALVEIEKGNPFYKNIVNKKFVIAEPVLAEFFYVLLKERDEKTALYWMNKLRPFSKSINLDVWIKSIKYRYDNKKQNLSIFDCIGYIYSLENKMRFVTGDKAFLKKKNVLFIK